MGLVSANSVKSALDYDSYAVGNPVEGVEVKIVDEKCYIVPVGISGEIYIRKRDRLKRLFIMNRKNVCIRNTFVLFQNILQV
jgi:acyl-coenzyme A synthetase/AMP-(fatty) acid ligase